jgi:hypothetical protein
VTEGEDVDVDAAVDEDAEAAVLGVNEDVVAAAAPAIGRHIAKHTV